MGTPDPRPCETQGGTLVFWSKNTQLLKWSVPVCVWAALVRVFIKASLLLPLESKSFFFGLDKWDHFLALSDAGQTLENMAPEDHSTVE